jgi:hypothetical protein
MSEDGKFRVEKFNGQNYQLWKMQMEDYLYQKDLFLPLSGVAKKPAEPGSVGGFQYFERKDNEGFDGCVGQIV